jgi:ribonuclease BN (tRNA processing enzyme)
MLLTVLGCSGSVPGPGAPTSGYLLEADGFRLVVDLGNGTLAELQSRCSAFDIDALLLSHLHPDHCADFSALTVLRRYHPDPPHDPTELRLPVYGPDETADRLAAAYAPSAAERAETDLSDVYDFRPLRAGQVKIGPFTVDVFDEPHPCQAYGFRFADGSSTLAYTGDTGACPTLVELARGVDVLLAEASWTHADGRPPNLHLSGTEAGQLATNAGAGRLFLTHIAPWSDADAIHAEAAAAFAGEVTRVRQGASYRL